MSRMGTTHYFLTNFKVKGYYPIFFLTILRRMGTTYYFLNNFKENGHCPFSFKLLRKRISFVTESSDSCKKRYFSSYLRCHPGQSLGSDQASENVFFQSWVLCVFQVCHSTPHSIFIFRIRSFKFLIYL